MTVLLDATSADAFRRLWGMTLLERNLRLVERLGAGEVVILAREEDRSRATRRRFARLVEPVVQSAERATWRMVEGVVRQSRGPVLVLEANGVYDRRFAGILWQAAAPAAGQMNGQPLEAAALLVDAGSLAAVASTGDTDWTQSARGATDDVEMGTIELSGVGGHDSNLRKAVAPCVIAVVDSDSSKRADRFLRELAGKGINDLMGEFIHPPIEFALTRMVSTTPITPNQVSYLNIILSAAALPLFAAGCFWDGIAVNLVRGVTDGVDGKLARLTLRESEGGHVLDHAADTLYLPLLFAAFGYHLADGDPYSRAALSSYLLQLFYWPNRVFSSWYKTFLGVTDSDFRRSDRIVRRFHPKRNTFILLLIICMLFGAPEMALYGITALTAFMLFFRIARLDQEGRRLQRERESGDLSDS